MQHDYAKRLKQAKLRIASKSHLPPPQSHALHIPTPKSSHLPSILHDTTWRDHQYNEWTRNDTGGWNVPIDQVQDTTPNVDMESLSDARIATCHPCNKPLQIRIQNDIGANRCVTDMKDLIIGYKDIDAYPMGGIKKEDIAIVCTGKGYLPWYSTEGLCTMVEIFYSENCDGTLISPTNIVATNSIKYQGFVIESNCDSGTGHLKLLHRDGVTHCTYPMTCTNNLWYHMYDPPP